MNDVVGQIVLTTSDEYLGAGDAVGAISLWDGLRLDNAQIGTGVRLSQTHGAGPLA